MIQKEKMSKILCTLLISGLIFTGCGNTSQESVEMTETNQENVETSDEQETDIITGWIKEIDDKTITLIAMGGEMPDGQPGGGNVPDMPEGE